MEETTLENSIEQSAYETIMKIQPPLAYIIGRLIDRGQTPMQIAKRIEVQDVFLAAITEMAAAYMKTTGIRPGKDGGKHRFEQDDQEEPDDFIIPG